MPDTYTNRESEDDRRRREDPCYDGHDYIEFDRKSVEVSWHDYVEGNCACQFEENSYGGYDLVRNCGKHTYMPNHKTVISYRCSRCGAETSKDA